ncbi:MAG: PLP-dependent transferase, partial [archaeon]
MPENNPIMQERVQDAFKVWSEKGDQIITPENFSTEEEIQNVINGFESRYELTNVVNKRLAADEFDEIFAGTKPPYHYGRAGHNNRTILENRITAIETAGLSHPEWFETALFGWGMDAISTVLTVLGRQDGRFIRGKVMYGHTASILDTPTKKGCDSNGNEILLNDVGSQPALVVDLKDTKNLEKALSEHSNILGIDLEPFENPTLGHTDVRETSKLAHKYGIPVIADLTFTPTLINPFRMGADIVVHSATKYYSGGGDLSGGFAIMPNEIAKEVKSYQTSNGRVMTHIDAGMYVPRVPKVLNRIITHSKNAAKLARELNNIDKIEVLYKDMGNKTRDGFAGGVISFVFKGNENEAYIKARKMGNYLENNKREDIKLAVSLGDKETLVFPEALAGKSYLTKTNVPFG